MKEVRTPYHRNMYRNVTKWHAKSFRYKKFKL
jgi:hypothetical protein